jgi:diguanylate cyclase (GGDEF)-like protein
VARIGGDEILIVLCGAWGTTADPAVIGKKVLQELSRPFHIVGNELDISCSIGISIYPQDGRDVSTLAANADTAMYQAKKSGRNDYRFFDSGAALPYVGRHPVVFRQYADMRMAAGHGGG